MRRRDPDYPSLRLANRLLEAFCQPELLEEVRGDLEEVYQERCTRMRPGWARLLYGIEVISFFRAPFRQRARAFQQARGPIMWKNYTRVALRTMRRHAIYTGINVSGLALGNACCILMLAFVRHEWGYDTFHEKTDRIHRVVSVQQDRTGKVKRTARVPAPLAPALTEEYPGIVQHVRLMEGRAVVQQGDQVFREEMLFVDASMLEVFSFPLRRGDPVEALSDLYSVVLSASMAEKYFGEDDAIGQVLQVAIGGDEVQDYTVTGVAEEIPSQSSIAFDFLARLEPHPNYRQMGENWTSSFLNTYVVLATPAFAEGFEAQSLPFVEKYFAEWLSKGRERGTLTEGRDAWQLELQPITAVHLDPDVQWGLLPASHVQSSYVLAGIALLVLLIACINFVTLALARSTSRAKEVGVRKVVGALRGQVVRQFWGEAFLMSLLALLLGFGLALLSLSTFNTLADKSLSLGMLVEGPMLLGLSGVVLVVGLLAGGYPALVLARYRPVDVLKGQLKTGRYRWGRPLVVVQFALSIALIINTLIMAQQLAFMHTKDLGFDTEQVAVIPMRGAQQQAEHLREVLRQEALQREDIVQVASVNNVFTRGWMSTTVTVEDDPIRLFIYWVDYDFIALMGLDLQEGRAFSRDFVGDLDSAMVVNEAMQQAFAAYGQVGERLDLWEGQYPIVGAVRDFHAFSLHQAIDPSALILSEKHSLGNLLVKMQPDDIPATLAFLEAQWKQFIPDKPFDFVFLDESVQQQYEADARWSRIVQYAAFLAILIACLGLFGLAALSVTQRTKEVGIRKVLGASVRSLVTLLTRQFVVIIGFAIALAVPLAYFAMQRWLDDFAYRIDISWWIFLAAGAAALGVALVTVSVHVIRAALADPVDSLRYE